MTITTDGQPCDPTPGPDEPTGSSHCGSPSTEYYQGPAQAGDTFCIAPPGTGYPTGGANEGNCYNGGEIFQIQSVNSDTSWTVTRGYYKGNPSTSPLQVHHIGDQIFMLSQGCSLYGPYTCSSDGNTWNWAVNPNGPVAQTPNNTEPDVMASERLDGMSARATPGSPAMTEMETGLTTCCRSRRELDRLRPAPECNVQRVSRRRIAQFGGLAPDLFSVRGEPIAEYVVRGRAPVPWR